VALSTTSPDGDWRRTVANSNLGITKVQAPGRDTGVVGDVAGWRTQTLLGTQFQLGN